MQTVTLDYHRPPLSLRLRWILEDLRMRAEFALGLKRRLTTEEWYAADCPPYPGMRRYWSPRDLQRHTERILRKSQDR